MVPDSDIAEKFKLGPNKVKYLANFDTKDVKDLLFESIKKNQIAILLSLMKI